VEAEEGECGHDRVIRWRRAAGGGVGDGIGRQEMAGSGGGGGNHKSWMETGAGVNGRVTSGFGLWALGFGDASLILQAS
jgi:hypothetical protein